MTRTEIESWIVEAYFAFGADTFSGRSQPHVTRTHNAGSYSWPWEFQHRWEVPFPANSGVTARLQQLIHEGWVEECPVNKGDYYHRLSLKAMALAKESGVKLEETEVYARYQDALKRAEAERKANPGRAVRL